MAGPGALIAGRYRIGRQLGAGGMGVVWEARDERLSRPVAIKQLRIQPGATDAETEVIVRRALREARISARLHHPYAVSVFDVVEHEGKPCIVMELVPSMPLSQVMRELGRLSPGEAAQVGSQVAAALAAAHALGIVHRDVKPGNVLIGDDGTARICDFGISRAYGDTTLTMTGMITGTPAYLAPEAARGEESTFASDVYSLGATLYAAVEGEPPAGTEGNAIAVLYRVAAGELRPPDRAGALAPLLVAMMSTDTAARPTMAEAAEQLAALAHSGRGQARPAPSPAAIAGQTQPVSPEAQPAPDTLSAPTPAAPDTPLAPMMSAVSLPEDTLRQRADPAPAPDPPEPDQRPDRRGLVAGAVVLIALVAVVVLAAGLPTLRGWLAGGPGSGTSATPSPAGEPTAAELAQAVTDYYALLPDDTDAAWGLLTPSYQRQAGGRDSYDGFWNTIDTVTATNVDGTSPNQARATLTYVLKSGHRTSTERRSFRLVRMDGVLKIDRSSVI